MNPPKKELLWGLWVMVWTIAVYEVDRAAEVTKPRARCDGLAGAHLCREDEGMRLV